MTPRPAFRRSRLVVMVALASIVIFSLICFRENLLEKAGTFLNVGRAPVRADAALVLAGGMPGDRILKGAELKRQGYVPMVYVSGPAVIYETPECAISVPFAVRHGYADADFRCIPNREYNSTGEARVCCAALQRAGIRTALLVTTAYHSRRAEGIYRRLCPRIAFTTVTSEDPMFQNRRWWEAREGRKTILQEYLKLITAPLGL